MPFGYIRFFQTYATPKLLSLFIDDQIYHKNWSYEDFTPYFKLSSGHHVVCIKETKTDILLLEKKFNVKPSSAFTYLLSEHPKKEKLLHLFILEDTRKSICSPHAFLRFAHFSKHTPAIKLQSGTEHLFFKNILYTQLTHYMPLEPGPYPFQLLDVEADHLLVHLKSKPIKIGRLYTFYLIGHQTKEYPLKIVRSIDGPSFLPLKKPSSEAF